MANSLQLPPAPANASSRSPSGVQSRSQYAVRCDGQCAVSDTGGVPHGVRDGRRGTDDPDLSRALDAGRVVQVFIVEPADLNVRDVRVRGNVVSGEVGVDVGSEGRI